MFDFLKMFNNYEERKVNNFKGKDCEGNDFCLDTCSVTDSDEPYETALSHPFYNDNDWIILETYKTKEEAVIGHNRWFDILINKQLPEQVTNHIQGSLKRLLDDEIININRKNIE